MKLISVHEWLINRVWVQRALLRATLDHDHTPVFLVQYVRCSFIMRVFSMLVPIALTAWAMASVGPWWPLVWMLGAAWVLGWRRVLGCQVLSNEDRESLAMFLRSDPARSQGAWEKSNLAGIVDTVDDWRVIMQVLHPIARSEMQARVLQGETAAKPAARPASRL